jgi:hypothetical protein
MASASHHGVAVRAVAIAASLVLLVGARLAIQQARLPNRASAAGPDAAATREGPATVPRDLAAMAREVRDRRAEVAATRKRMVALLTEAEELRARAATLDRMIADGRLTQALPFPLEDTSVRALQGVLEEVSEAARTSPSAERRVQATAAIARERLGRKFVLLRDRMIGEAQQFEQEAGLLRGQVQTDSARADRLQDRLVEQLRNQSE